MKRILALFLTFFLLLCTFPMNAFADTGGSGNLDGGGGGMDGGSSDNFWDDGMDGVRVTVIEAGAQKAVTTPIDLTNKKPTVQLHFGKVSKIQYRSGTGLSPTTSTYRYYNPKTPLPWVISTGDGKTNKDAIKAYFCSEYAIKLIAQKSGISYTNLINGKYKLLLEPIAFFTFNGQKWAMTATEAAKYDNQVGGKLRAKMVSLSHQNLPLSMFLEYADLGFPAYKGSTTKRCPNDTIISSLGLGVVRFTNAPPPPSDQSGSGYEYRVNTDVITPVTLSASNEINPKGTASVTFKINRSTYKVNNIVIPEGESQLVWVKWRTPSTPQTLTVTVNTTKGSLSQNSIQAKIVDLSGKDPPDPKATDTRGSWSAVSIPSRAVKTSASWSVWWAKWHTNWVWIENWKWIGGKKGHWVDKGKWKDEGWYDFARNNYSASLSANMSLLPDDKVPTASGNRMKSGYGVKITASASVSTSAPVSNYTTAQTAVSYFPEFKYQTYWRLLELSASGRNAQFQFRNNKYSTYNRRSHFVPIWFPDGAYTVNTYIMDVWTPAGMLSANTNGSVQISGSLYADWHIGITD